MFNSRLKQVQQQLTNWWEFGDQKNPCILMQVLKKEHGPIPDRDDLEGFWTDPDFVIRRQMALIDNTDYYGQAVPCHYVDLGSSAMVGAMGGKMEFVDKETVWAHPIYKSVEDVLKVRLDQQYSYYRTIREITQRSAALAKNHHYVAPFALEGMTDILAGLYGTENYMMDLVCNTDRVKQAMEHVKQLWLEAFADIQEIIAESGNYGGIGWAGVWAPGTTFPIQEDASYMISPDMFREFCLPHVRDMVDAMEYPFYHLDGVGQIPHLDCLLEIEKIKVIQWQPGAGKERLDQWYDLIRRILAAKKSVQLYAQPDEVDGLVKAVGTRGLLVICPGATHEQAARLMETYGD